MRTLFVGWLALRDIPPSRPPRTRPFQEEVIAHHFRFCDPMRKKGVILPPPAPEMFEAKAFRKSGG
jgi:hypothetical protein